MNVYRILCWTILDMCVRSEVLAEPKREFYFDIALPPPVGG